MTYTDEQCAEAVALSLRGHAWDYLEEQQPGIRAAVKRYDAKLRKRNSRASAEQRIELPLPGGTAAALRRVCEAAGDEPVALLSQVVHLLDRVLAQDAGLFRLLTTHTVDVAAVVERYSERLGQVQQEDEQ